MQKVLHLNHINTFRIVIEQWVECQVSLYLLCIDIKQVFDTINRQELWQILTINKVPQKLVYLIKELYTDATSKVTHEGKIV